jgi:hypothetical protein
MYLTTETSTERSTESSDDESYLYLFLSIENNRLSTRICLLYSNILTRPAYVAYVSHLVRYDRACTQYQDVRHECLHDASPRVTSLLSFIENRFVKNTLKVSGSIMYSCTRTGSVALHVINSKLSAPLYGDDGYAARFRNLMLQVLHL